MYELKTNAYDGRYYVLNWTTTQNVANNTSTLNWSIGAVGGKNSRYTERTLKVVLDGNVLIDKTDKISRYEGSIKTGSLTINHNADGTKSISASIQAAVYVSTINCSASNTFTLDKIARKATITAAPNFNDEENPTITYSNPAGNAADSLDACISLTGAADDIAYRSISKTGTSYTFNLTEAERNVLRNAAKNSNSITVQFYIRTTVAGTNYYSYLSKTLTIINSKPTLSVSVLDTNSATTALTGSSARLVKYYSNAKYTLTPTFKKGAVLSHYLFNKSMDGTREDWDMISNSSETISKYEGSGKFDFKVIDSRNNEASASYTAPVVEYIKLTCEIGNNIPTTDGVLNTTISGNYFNSSFGATNNALTIQYRFKENSGSFSSWTNLSPSISNGTYTANINKTGLNYLNTYTIEVKVSDKLASITKQKVLKTVPVYDWSGSDFNFNVPVNIGNTTVLSKDSSGNIVLSAGNKQIRMKPQGSNNTAGQAILYPNGNLELSGSLNTTYGITVSNGDLTINGIKYKKSQLYIPVDTVMSSTQGIQYFESGTTEIETVPNGLVFVWKSTLKDGYMPVFVPRSFYTDRGGGYIAMTDAYMGMYKLVNITTHKIWGTEQNTLSGSVNGLAYNNNVITLKYIIGV